VTADESVLLLNDPWLYGLDLQAKGLMGALARLTRALALARSVMGMTVRQPFLSVVFANRMWRTLGLLQALVVQFRAGTLKPPRPRNRTEAATPAAPGGHPPPESPEARAAAADPAPASAPPAGAPQGAPGPAMPSLPRGRGWLLRLVPRCGHVSGALTQLMAEPEFLALLDAAPQAGRLLRPLYWMLGLKPPPQLALPKRRRPAAEHRVAGKQARRPSYAQRLRALISSNPSVHTRIPSADWESSHRRKRGRPPRNQG
jgi:hypothetical protein